MRPSDLVDYLQQGAGQVPGDPYSGLQLGNAPTEGGAPAMGGDTNGGLNNATGPRELHPAAPQTPGGAPDVHRVDPQQPPSGGAGAAPPPGNTSATPTRSQAPQPSVSLPPTPFQPLEPSMSPDQAAAPQVGRVNPGMGGMPGNHLFGKAGGLLGGGMGVPGSVTGEQPQPDLSQLIQMLLGSH